PSGAFVPSRTPGTWLRDRIDEWHPPNPAASTITSTFVLCESDRIQSLERDYSREDTHQSSQFDPLQRLSTHLNRLRPLPLSLAFSLDPQLHPFRPNRSIHSLARDAAYAPPRDRNVGVRVPNPPAAKKPEVAYRTTAPVYDEKIASEVFGCSMDAPITLTQRELLSLSPEVRAQVRDATTSRRVA
ncbi:hypothetical protein C8F01DRAFT_937200, partial [Mycena amicta]